MNPASARRCDCGFSFVDGSQGKPLEVRPVSDRPDLFNEAQNQRAKAVLIRLGAKVAALVLILIIAMIVMMVRGT